MGKFIDRVGQRFGRWLVVSRAPNVRVRKCTKVFYHCRCDCGTERIVNAANLARGISNSCGCYGEENPGRLKHGFARKGKVATEYWIWSNMLRRCNDPAHERYKDYAGRGIKVCERWHIFENFLEDMGRRPAGLSLHRVNNDGNYEKSNCKWATDDEQANCKQNSFFVEMNGRVQTFTRWCRELHLNEGTAYDRIVRGWNPVAALLKPVKPGNYRRGPRG